MSSIETSGASAEATVTTQPTGENAPALSFGSTRGSGLARGKRPSNSPAATATPTGYKPTAIEILNAPREYQNPFAPVNPAPVAPVTTEPAASVEKPEAVSTPPVAPAPIADAPVATAPVPREPAPARAYVKPAGEMFPLDDAPASSAAETAEPAELNILPPERAKITPAQTWESEGFQATRAPREERPRQEERPERSAPADLSAIPEKFLYVRPGYNYVPTPSNYGGAPRESRPAGYQPPAAQAAGSRPTAAPEAKTSGGIFGWLKSLFSDSSAAPAAAAGSPVAQPAGERQYSRNRDGRGRGQGGGGQGQSYEGGQRRSRGGRGRGPRGGEYRGGGDRGGSPGGSSAT